MTSLMQKAQGAKPVGSKFQKPEILGKFPQQLQDQVQRIVAAGMKVIYSPEMRDQVMQDIQRQAPVPQKLSESALGLLLTLDQQSKGGIPEDALTVAAVELLAECAEILSSAGQAVSQEDYQEAVRMLIVGIGRKLGKSDEDIMGAAASGLNEGAASGAQRPDAAPGAAAGAAPMPAAPRPGAPDPRSEEEQAWNEGA